MQSPDEIEGLTGYRLFTEEVLDTIKELQKRVSKNFKKGEMSFEVTLQLLVLKGWTDRVQKFRERGEKSV